MTIRVATRRSELALTQTRWVIAELKARHPDLEFEEVQLTTKGDQIVDRPLYEVGGKALFVSELEAALLRGDADCAVHSYKDVPGPKTPGLEISCVPRREDARDFLVHASARTLDELPQGARVGTSSVRRAAQLVVTRPDLVIEPIRGNVDTRLRKLEENALDAIVLAAAGLNRIGRNPAGAPLDPDVMIPSPCQGCLAIQTRVDDHALRSVVETIEDAAARIESSCERGVLETLEGDCRTPIAAYARYDLSRRQLRLRAFTVAPNGKSSARMNADSNLRDAQSAYDLGAEIARTLQHHCATHVD